jgi:hypothetical protein
MKEILAYILTRVLTTLGAAVTLTITTKVEKLLTEMAKDPIDAELATQQLVASRIYAVHGLPGLKSLVAYRIIPDFIFMAYAIRFDLGMNYPQSGYSPDTQPDPFVGPGDMTNDEVPYKKMVTFLASRNTVDYSIIQNALK